MPKGTPRRSFVLAALLNTEAMWGLTGRSKDAPTPLLAATLADRGAAVATPRAGAALQQPDGGAPLPVGRLPEGFFAGRAALAGGRVYLVDEAAAAAAAATADGAAADAGAPTLAWAVVEPSLSVAGGSPCTTATAGWGAGFDFAADASRDFGAAVQPAWERFVLRAVNATRLRDQAAALYGKRLAGSDSGAIVAAAADDAELRDQLARTDVSPFFVPSPAIPRAAAAAGVAAAGGGVTAAGTVYGGRAGGAGGAGAGSGTSPATAAGGGRGGFEGWSCWNCAAGKAGYFVSAAAYNYGLGGGPGAGGLNLNGGYGSGIMGGQPGGTLGLRNGGYGGGPFGNFGPGPYGGGYGTGGWGGGYFGGFYSGSNVGGMNWGSSCQIMCQRAWGGTGGLYGWGTGLAPNGWGPFGIFPFGGWGGGGRGGGFGGWGGWGRRRLAEDADAADADAADGVPTNKTTAIVAAAAAAGGNITAAGEIVASSVSAAAVAAASAAVTAAQVEATGAAMRPVCVAPAATCAAAARAATACRAGAEPDVALSARLVTYGALAAAGGAGGLGFAAPALAVGRGGGALTVLATYSGAGRIKGSAAPAYPGLASFAITAAPLASSGNGGSGSGAPSATLRIEQRGSAPVPAAGAWWPAPPAVAVQPGSGVVFATVDRPAAATPAPAWVSVLEADR